MNGQNFRQSLTTITQAVKGDILIQRLKNRVYIAGAALQFNAVQSFKDEGDDFIIVLASESAKELIRQVKKADRIDITVNEHNSVFCVGNNTFTHSTLDSQSISLKRLLFRFKEDFSFSISGPVLRNAISKSFAFISKDVGDIRFKGAHIVSHDNVIEIMTTDNATLSINRITALKVDKPVKTIVHKDLDFTLKLMLDMVYVGIEGDNLWYKSESEDKTVTSYVVMKTIYIDDASTPMLPYEKAVLEPFKALTERVVFSIEKSELADMTSDVIFYAEKAKFNVIDFEMKPDGLTMSASNEAGKAQVTSSTSTGLDKLSNAVAIKVSATSLQKFLSIADAGSVTFQQAGNRLMAQLPNMEVYITTFMI